MMFEALLIVVLTAMGDGTLQVPEQWQPTDRWELVIPLPWIHHDDRRPQNEAYIWVGDASVPCEEYRPTVERVAAEFPGRVHVYSASLFPENARQWGVAAVPTTVIIYPVGSELQEVERWVGKAEYERLAKAMKWKKAVSEGLQDQWLRGER
jgi:hypothetical protein